MLALTESVRTNKYTDIQQDAGIFRYKNSILLEKQHLVDCFHCKQIEKFSHILISNIINSKKTLIKSTQIISIKDLWLRSFHNIKDTEFLCLNFHLRNYCEFMLLKDIP